MKNLKPKITLCLIAGQLLFTFLAFGQRTDQTIYFKKPAHNYLESLPLGNGQLGAMIMGNPNRDRIILNEKSLWSGGVQEADREDAYQYLKPIQQYLLEGKNKEAQALLQEHFISKGEGSGHGRGANVPYGSYQTLGDLWIHWQDTLSTYTDYSRRLDLENALATTQWTREGVRYTQEAFSSIADDVVLIKLSASKKGKLHFKLALDRKENASIEALGDDRILMKTAEWRSG